MIVASWNVNSLKVRLDQVLAWLRRHQPDVLGLQETKLTDDRFPVQAFAELGYHSVFSGQPTYNGVALLTRCPPGAVQREITGFEDPQKRVIAAELGDIRLINLYVVNGKAVGDPKYEWKLRWLDAVTSWIESELAKYPRLIVLGDFNIAPDERDVHDPAAWHEQILCSTPERQALARLLALGLHDSFRLFEQPDGRFSWWDYRAAGFRRNRGLRIDLVLCSEPLRESCQRAWIDIEPRRAERPSDHAPVVAEFRV